jgi:rod shape-determining protein MreC
MMMVFDHHYHQFDQARSFLSFAVYPIQWVVDRPIRLAAELKEYMSSKHQLVTENEKLRQEQLLQNGHLQKFCAIETENERLRALLQQSLQHRQETLAIAEILRVDADPFSHRILLDKGKNHQVKVGQPIIDAEGVMGEIIEINDLSATAILITDASHAIPVEIARNGVRGILVGTGSYDHLTLQYLPKTAEIQMGDVLVTSGLGGRYPAGYPVGVVVKITEDPADSFVTVHVAPKARLDRGRQVLLVDCQNSNDKPLNDSLAIEAADLLQNQKKIPEPATISETKLTEAKKGEIPAAKKVEMLDAKKSEVLEAKTKAPVIGATHE